MKISMRMLQRSNIDNRKNSDNSSVIDKTSIFSGKSIHQKEKKDIQIQSSVKNICVHTHTQVNFYSGKQTNEKTNPFSLALNIFRVKFVNTHTYTKEKIRIQI